MNPLTTSFAGLTDPRIEQRKLYPLESLIFITISATVAGAD
ncbi:MAG: transposase family protein, partial [Bacteroidetes bacterium]|nr:transposase family protein [Bacteroidota bacterium]